MDDVTARILSEAQRLSRGAAGDVPVAFSPLRGRTLSSSPSASTDKSLSDLLEEAAYGLSSQVRTGVTRLRGGDVTAVEEEMRADPSAGSYAATYRDLGVPGFLANVLGFGTEILEPGPGEFAALGKALPGLAAALPSSVMRALGKASGLADEAGEAIRLGHGTGTTFDIPRESSSGLFGQGFYTAPIENRYRSEINEFNEYAQEGQFPQVRPGFAGGKILDAMSKEPFSEVEAQRILSLWPEDSQNAAVMKSLYDRGLLNPDRFYEYMYFYVPIREVKPILTSLGYAGVRARPHNTIIYNPARNFVPNFDATAIRGAIERAGEAGRLSSEEVNEALRELASMMGDQ